VAQMGKPKVLTLPGVVQTGSKKGNGCKTNGMKYSNKKRGRKEEVKHGEMSKGEARKCWALMYQGERCPVFRKGGWG